jgi:hypothetical protein
MKSVLFFREISEVDISLVGVKGVNLARLFKKGFKVPPGFVVSKEACDALIFKKKSIVSETIKHPDSEKCIHLQKQIRNSEFPEDVADEIIEAYLSLSVSLDSTSAASLLHTEEVFVAVRSSYIDELGDVPELSQKTILNVKGKDRLFKAIVDCIAANFSLENIEYRKKHSLELSTAIIIQRMVDSEKSGVAYSKNPETGTKETVVNACFGLGEGLASGSVFPDSYVIDANFEIKDVSIAEKQYEYVRDIETDATVKNELGEKSYRQVLYDKEITEIARTLKRIVNALGKEQKIEWAIRKEILYILQTKEIAAPAEPAESVEMEIYESEEEPPELIDISPIEEDLDFLQEIESYEDVPEEAGEMNEAAQEIVLEEPESVVTDIGENPMETPVEEIASVEDITEPLHEEIKDESIFSGYVEPEIGHKYGELAKLNAGNAVFYCHLLIKDRLWDRLKKYVREIPEDFEKLLNELLEYERVDNEDEIRRLNKARDDFLKGKYPEPEDVEMALRLI